MLVVPVTELVAHCQSGEGSRVMANLYPVFCHIADLTEHIIEKLDVEGLSEDRESSVRLGWGTDWNPEVEGRIKRVFYERLVGHEIIQTKDKRGNNSVTHDHINLKAYSVLDVRVKTFDEKTAPASTFRQYFPPVHTLKLILAL